MRRWRQGYADRRELLVAAATWNHLRLLLKLGGWWAAWAGQVAPVGQVLPPSWPSHGALHCALPRLLLPQLLSRQPLAALRFCPPAVLDSDRQPAAPSAVAAQARLVSLLLVASPLPWLLWLLLLHGMPRYAWSRALLPALAAQPLWHGRRICGALLDHPGFMRRVLEELQQILDVIQ